MRRSIWWPAVLSRRSLPTFSGLFTSSVYFSNRNWEWLFGIHESQLLIMMNRIYYLFQRNFPHFGIFSQSLWADTNWVVSGSSDSMVIRLWAWISETRCYITGCCPDFSVCHRVRTDCRESAAISPIRRSSTGERSSTACFLLSSEETPRSGETKTKTKSPGTTSGSRKRYLSGRNPQRFMNSNIMPYSSIHSQEVYF